MAKRLKGGIEISPSVLERAVDSMNVNTALMAETLKDSEGHVTGVRVVVPKDSLALAHAHLTKKH